MSNTTNQSAPTVGEVNIAAALEVLTNKIDSLQAQLNEVQSFQHGQVEMLEEATPIVREVMDAVTEQFSAFEKKGYFAFGRESVAIAERVVSGYSAEEVKSLGDNIITIMDTIKKLTQPDMLSFIDEATEAFYHPEELKQVGLYGMFKASKEDDVRKGFGVMLSILRSVGRGSDSLKGLRGKGKFQRSGRSREERKALISSKLAPKKRKAPTTEKKVKKVKEKKPALEGFSEDGFILDIDSWTEEIALKAAQYNDIPELTVAHWKVLRYARSAYAEQGKSPNIRQITLGAEVPTKEIYTLFPKAPGNTISKIAGISKPGGCL